MWGGVLTPRRPAPLVGGGEGGGGGADGTRPSERVFIELASRVKLSLPTLTRDIRDAD